MAIRDRRIGATGAAAGAPAKAATARTLKGPDGAPVPAAVLRLRALILTVAVTLTAVEAAQLVIADEPGYAVLARSVWAGLRVLGLLTLLRLVRLGRASARPLGVVLAVTTVFAAARLVTPRTGTLVPQPIVLIGLLVLAGLCAVMVAWLYYSPAVAAHLTRPGRTVSGWMVTARVAALSYPALLAVPLFIAVGDLFTGAVLAVDEKLAVFLLTWWMGLVLVLAATLPVLAFLAQRGLALAQGLLWLSGLVVAVAGPLFCLVLNGTDALVRDGIPIAVTALLGIYALHRA